MKRNDGYNRGSRSSDRLRSAGDHLLHGAISAPAASGIAVRCRIVFLLVLVAQFASACNFSSPATTTGQTTHPNVGLVQSKVITLTTDTEGTSSRPEIAATDSRIFTLYLANNKTFDYKIFDSSLYSIISTTTLVRQTTDYGTPTDMRITQDNQYLYAFYETVSNTATYLWGAKYLLNDTLDLVCSTATPLASSLPVLYLPEGGEVLNDPAPLVGPNSIFIVTRLMSSLSTTGQTVYRVRELATNDLSLIKQFDLDLSSVAAGRARVSSLFYFNNTIYMAVPSTASDVNLFDNLVSDDGALSNIILVKMQPDWTFNPSTDVLTISSDTGYVENYVSGFETDGTYVYLSFKKSVGAVGTGEQSAIVKVFDLQFNELMVQVIKKITWGFGEIRPALQIHGKTLYSGQTSNQNSGPGDGELSVYNIVY